MHDGDAAGVPGFARQGQPELSEPDFDLFRNVMYRWTGIRFTEAKRSLIAARLAKRLRDLHLDSYRKYYSLVTAPDGEREKQIMVDLLTTNETHFFREPAHFHHLGKEVLAARKGREPFRIWSAACSTGEEVYSLAMICDDRLGAAPWEIFGSDINETVVAGAEQALYPMHRADEIPDFYKRKYCLKGVRSMQGFFRIHPRLRERCSFARINLAEKLPAIGEFDCIFLRNTMIYFDVDSKREITARVGERLKRGGLFYIGHSETLHGISQDFENVRPSVYRKPGAAPGGTSAR